MGQYYYVVNVDKRQYLDPHKFGSGLKLMEFSSDAEGIAQALCILLASGNDCGSGDLRVPADLPDAALVGSWAGDRIVVAGDYMEDWLFVPDDLRERDYFDDEEPRVFGRDREGRRCGETLYSAAGHFFEDLSNRIMRVIAVSAAPYHRFAAADTAEDGWRRIPASGELPEKPPRRPLAGRKVWRAYQEHCLSAGSPGNKS